MGMRSDPSTISPAEAYQSEGPTCLTLLPPPTWGTIRWTVYSRSPSATFSPAQLLPFSCCWLLSKLVFSLCGARSWFGVSRWPSYSLLVLWHSILDSVFVYCNILRRYFDYFELSCREWQQLIVRLGRQTLCRKGSHRRAVEKDILAEFNRLWRSKSLTVVISVVWRCPIFICIPSSCLIVGSRCNSLGCRTCRDVILLCHQSVVRLNYRTP